VCESTASFPHRDPVISRLITTLRGCLVALTSFCHLGVQMVDEEVAAAGLPLQLLRRFLRCVRHPAAGLK
jgi:hypothetical protein